MKEILLKIKDGRITFINDDDAVAAFRPHGRITAKRVSHVEMNADGLWVPDLSPVGGPCLAPHAKRSDAVKAEIAWLKENLFNDFHVERRA